MFLNVSTEFLGYIDSQRSVGWKMKKYNPQPLSLLISLKETRAKIFKNFVTFDESEGLRFCLARLKYIQRVKKSF